jgi:hypothetical protein
MTWKQFEAAQRREERAVQKRRRELERLGREREKQSERDLARLAVETYENELEVLLSVHKSVGLVWDWASVAAMLTPPLPVKAETWERRARQRLAAFPGEANVEERIEAARSRDEAEYNREMSEYRIAAEKNAKLVAIAKRILQGDCSAFYDAIAECSPFDELAVLGSSFEFLAHSSELIECQLKVKGSGVIPAEIKSLTSSGKLSEKAMPRSKFHAHYQDYVCGCILRAARELFALLPVNQVLVTAHADIFEPTGNFADHPVLSVALSRQELERLNFDSLDPSDAVDTLRHRGDFKASRKADAFQPITPLSAANLAPPSAARASFDSLVTQLRQLRIEIREAITEYDGPLPLTPPP